VSKLVLMSIAILLTGCAASNQLAPSNTENEVIKKLIQTGCENLPSLYSLKDDNRPVVEVWRKSREAFGELSRVDVKYLQVAESLERVSDLIDPIMDGLEDVNRVDAFCAGLGSLTR